MEVQFIFAPGHYPPKPRHDIAPDGSVMTTFDPVQIVNTFGHTRMGTPKEDRGDGSWTVSTRGEDLIVHDPEVAWEARPVE